VYTPNHTDGDFHVLLDKLDFYVPAHFVGWIVKVRQQQMLELSECSVLSYACVRHTTESDVIV